MDNPETKTVLIGGVTGGIGSALARQLSSSGWLVSGYCRSGECKDAELSAATDGRLLACDATDSGQVEQTFAKAEEALGGQIDAYAHCIGSILLKTAHQTSDQEWADTLRVNLDSAFYALRSAVKRMQKQKAGAIVFVSTGAARAGLPAHEAIAAAKAGIEGLVRSAAASYASRGVRVNCVAPGMVETPLAEPLIGGDTGRKFSEAMHPLGRIGTAKEVASLMAWLIGEDASWVSGEVYSIDGGLAHLRQRPKL